MEILMILVFLGGAGVFAYFYFAARKEKKEAAAQKQKELEELNRIRQAMLDGSWEFPSEKLYEKCTRDEISTIDDPFSCKKMEAIFKEFLTDAGADEAIVAKYLPDAGKYYREGKEKTEAAEKEWNLSIHTATKTVSSYDEYFDLLSKCKDIRGVGKRKYMLLCEIEESLKSLQHAKESGNIQLFMPVLEKEKDWALHGGIAAGIAGGAAGVATAVHTMQENVQIRERNSQQINIAAQINTQLLLQNAEPWRMAVIRGSEENIVKCEKALNCADEKIVLDNIPTDSLMDAYTFEIDSTGSNKVGSNYPIGVYLKPVQVKSLNLNLPAGADMVLDGILCGKLYTADEQPDPGIPCGELMGDIAFIIPWEGVSYYDNMEDMKNIPWQRKLKRISLSGYCTRFFGHPDTKYKVVFEEKQNLWLMER